jgi:hypothetical protein
LDEAYREKVMSTAIRTAISRPRADPRELQAGSVGAGDEQQDTAGVERRSRYGLRRAAEQLDYHGAEPMS